MLNQAQVPEGKRGGSDSAVGMSCNDGELFTGKRSVLGERVQVGIKVTVPTFHQRIFMANLTTSDLNTLAGNIRMIQQGYKQIGANEYQLVFIPWGSYALAASKSDVLTSADKQVIAKQYQMMDSITVAVVNGIMTANLPSLPNSYWSWEIGGGTNVRYSKDDGKTWYTVATGIQVSNSGISYVIQSPIGSSKEGVVVSPYVNSPTVTDGIGTMALQFFNGSFRVTRTN